MTLNNKERWEHLYQDTEKFQNEKLRHSWLISLQQLFSLMIGPRVISLFSLFSSLSLSPLLPSPPLSSPPLPLPFPFPFSSPLLSSSPLSSLLFSSLLSPFLSSSPLSSNLSSPLSWLVFVWVESRAEFLFSPCRKILAEKKRDFWKGLRIIITGLVFWEVGVVVTRGISCLPGLNVWEVHEILLETPRYFKALPKYIQRLLSGIRRLWVPQWQGWGEHRQNLGRDPGVPPSLVGSGSAPLVRLKDWRSLHLWVLVIALPLCPEYLGSWD